MFVMEGCNVASSLSARHIISKALVVVLPHIILKADNWMRRGKVGPNVHPLLGIFPSGEPLKQFIPYELLLPFPS
jgi:hypothetical protein